MMNSFEMNDLSHMPRNETPPTNVESCKLYIDNMKLRNSGDKEILLSLIQNPRKGTLTLQLDGREPVTITLSRKNILTPEKMAASLQDALMGTYGKTFPAATVTGITFEEVI
jgi:hypothetical protein